MKVVVALDEMYTSFTKAPDVYKYDNEKPLLRPDPDFVMTRNINGDICSKFGDPMWDYSAYQLGSTCARFNFKNHIPKLYIDEAKWLLFLIDRVSSPERRRNGNNFSVSTLYSYLIYVIKPITTYANQNELNIDSMLSDSTHLHKLISLNKNNVAFLNSFPSLLKIMCHFEYLKDDARDLINEDLLKSLNKSYISFKKEYQQTPVIPPRIYGNFLNQAWGIIEEYELIEKSFLNLIEVMSKWPAEVTAIRNGVTKDTRKRLVGSYLRDPQLKPIIKKYKWETVHTGLSKNCISKYVNNLQNVCKDLLQFYSGMRLNEVKNLPFYCLHTEKNSKRKHARLIGYTFKYSGCSAKGEWVTTVEVEKVIRILHGIANIFLTNVEGETNNKKCPLFISTRYLVKNHKIIKAKPGITINSYIGSQSILSNPLYNLEVFKITQEDINFLEMFEPETEWSSSKFSIGSTWNLTSHQFRRSLAVFAYSSGLVSIGSLQTQLHHLFVETSYYYANNAENCSFDVSGSEHISKVFLANEVRANFSLMVNDLLFSDEPLLGPAGKQQDKLLRKCNDKFNWIKDNRKDFEKKIKNGELAYKSTPLGGCGSISPCDKALTHSFTSCLDCNNASLKLSKINNTIYKLEQFIGNLEKGSVEERYEQSELNHLKKFKNNVVCADVNKSLR